jgi:hypothetical protein
MKATQCIVGFSRSSSGLACHLGCRCVAITYHPQSGKVHSCGTFPFHHCREELHNSGLEELRQCCDPQQAYLPIRVKRATLQSSSPCEHRRYSVGSASWIQLFEHKSWVHMFHIGMRAFRQHPKRRHRTSSSCRY